MPDPFVMLPDKERDDPFTQSLARLVSAYLDDEMPVKALPDEPPSADDPDVQRLADRLRAYLRGEYTTVADAVNARGALPDVEQLPLDLGDTIESLMRASYPLLIEQGWARGGQQLGVELAFNLENPRIQEVLDELAQKVRNVSATTREQIQALVGQAAREGWDMGTLAAMLMHYADIVSASRALTIARTESAAAQSKGAILRWLESGEVDRVQWITSDPCPVCAALSNKVVPIQSEFTPGIAHPPAHPNCRCALIAVLREVG